jgi:hypothetical protein
VSSKPSRKKPAAKTKPHPAQLKAIERLLEHEDYQAAVRRSKAMVKPFPNQGGLCRSLVEALHVAEGPSAAGLAAFDWAEQRRNSPTAQETLLYYSAELYLPALAGRAARRVRELGGDVPGRVPDPTDLRGLGHDARGPGSSVEDLERFEISQLYLAGQDLHGALRRLDGMEQSSACNNRAVALFHLQRVYEVLAVFMDVWQEHAEDLFAMSRESGAAGRDRGRRTSLHASKRARQSGHAQGHVRVDPAMHADLVTATIQTSPLRPASPRC